LKFKKRASVGFPRILNRSPMAGAGPTATMDNTFSVNDVQQLQYEPLPTETSIRVIEILPSEDDVIRCALTTVELIDKPCYNALSYTWGNPNTIYEKPDNTPSVSDIVDGLPQHIPGVNQKKVAQFDLEAYEFRTQHPIIAYEKLDWDAERRHAIEVNGCRFMVASNLLSFLQHFREKTRNDQAPWNGFVLEEENGVAVCTQFLWIDAISINQNDVDERNAQITIMDLVFRLARNVIGWLGAEQALSSVAIQAMKLIFRRTIDPDFKMKLNLPSLLLVFEPEGILWREWYAVFCLLQRLWFRRIWVVQEVVFAKNLVLVCGNENLHWSVLDHVLRFMKTYSLDHHLTVLGKEILSGGSLSRNDKILVPADGIIQFGFAPNDEWKGRIRVDAKGSYSFASGVREVQDQLGLPQTNLDVQEPSRKSNATPSDLPFEGSEPNNTKWHILITKMPLEEPQPMSIGSLMSMFRSCKAMEPRDKVFALVRIANRRQSPPIEIPLVVDYRMETAEVYRRAAEWILLSSGDLSLLTHVQDPARTAILQLHSWVPDFSVSTGTSGLTQLCSNGYCASGIYEKGTILADVKDATLRVEGLKVDVVGLVAGPSSYDFLRTAEIVVKLPLKYRSKPDEKCLLFSGPEDDGSRPAVIPLRSKAQVDERTSQIPSITRIEAWWRTLTADSIRGLHPAPISMGFAFADWIAVDLYRELRMNQTLSGTGLDLETVAPTILKHMAKYELWKALDAGEDGGFYTRSQLDAIQKIVNMKSDESIDIDQGGFRFLPDEWYVQKFFRNQMMKGHPASQEVVGIDNEALHSFKSRITEVEQGRRMFSTIGNLLGMGPPSAQSGDEVWVLKGLDVPIILRTQQGGARQIVGECYVHGIMHGEALEGGQRLEEVLLA
jgi:hypothetical protein